MKTIKHIRIAIADIFFTIAHKIDARDEYDLQAEFNRITPPQKPKMTSLKANISKE